MAITFEVSIYRDLIQTYPQWNLLRSFLESNDGGTIHVAEEGDFAVLHYQKDISNLHIAHVPWFRSVIWDIIQHRPVCVAPPKCSLSIPYETSKEANEAGLILEEMLDGFMINCFRVVGDKTLHITSRSKLNAAGKFYSEKSFRELFMEAYMNTSELSFYSETIIQDNSSDILSPDSSKGEVAVFYSFLVQHKEHRIVKNIENNL